MLDEASAGFIATLAASGLPPIHELSPHEARAAGARLVELQAPGPGMLRVEDVEGAEVELLGPKLEAHPRFPQRVNVGFMQVVERDHIRLRVYERGAGETLACGTGACAAVVVGRRWGLLDEEVTVDLPGGRLTIHWQGGDAPVWMIGPATRVFEGEIDL